MRGPIVISFLGVLSLVDAGAGAQTPRRIETAQALQQIVSRVDPVVPKEAAAKKIGGIVIADVIVDRTGRVASVTIVDGHMLLRRAAEAALRQWTFKPFASPVQVILEVRFPDPIKDEQDRISKEYWTASRQCRGLVDEGDATAERVCADALQKSERLPADRVLERSHSASDYATSLMAAGKTSEAIAQFRKALETRTPRVGGPDADSADLLQLIALLHHRLGEWAEAETAFGQAIAQYSGAIERTSSMAEVYVPRMKIALVRYASLKRATGEAEAAAALEARAAALEVTRPAAVPHVSVPRTSRTVDGVLITEPADLKLTADDVGQVRALLKGKRYFRLDAYGDVHVGGGGRKEADWAVDAFLAPEIDTRLLRRGKSAWLVSEPNSQKSARRWIARGTREYMQVALPGGNAADEPSFFIQGAPNMPIPANEIFASAVQFVRDIAVAAPNRRLMADVQPWPIEVIIAGADGSMSITLREPAGAGMQQVELQPKDGRWKITEVFGVAPSAR